MQRQCSASLFFNHKDQTLRRATCRREEGYDVSVSKAPTPCATVALTFTKTDRNFNRDNGYKASQAAIEKFNASQLNYYAEVVYNVLLPRSKDGLATGAKRVIRIYKKES